MSLAISPDEKRWLRMLGTLNEAQARLYVADKALDLGRGGVSRLAALAGMLRTTITKGIAELRGKQSLLADGRVRAMGGGRKPVEHADPAVLEHLEQIVGESTAGDPESPLRWTSKATRTIAEELRRRGHPIGAVTVGRCLQDMGYSLQANRKAKEGRQHEDRDAQFRYIARRVKAMLRSGAAGHLGRHEEEGTRGGDFKNGGREWQPQGGARRGQRSRLPRHGRGQGHSLRRLRHRPQRGLGQRGGHHDTAEFAVESIRRWWRLDGPAGLPGRARGCSIRADSGGSNGARSRAWKVELQSSATEIGLTHHGLPLPAGHQQVEQDRASAVFVHQPELAGAAAGQLRDRRQPHRRYDERVGALGQGRPRYQRLPDWGEDCQGRRPGSQPGRPLSTSANGTTPSSRVRPAALIRECSRYC